MLSPAHVESLMEMESVTDFYLPGDNPRAGVYYPGRIALTPDMHGLAIGLVESAKKKRLNNCTVSYMGLAFRCHVMPTPQGEMYIFRRMPAEIMTLKELGLPSHVTNQLLSTRLQKGGLIIVSGLPGNGKSTTLSSVIVDRLKKFGGICITVEDPVEMPLQGFHGEGYCLQRSIKNEEGFASAIRDALRAYPAKTSAMMMIGEVRDGEAATLALRSAVDGRLVMFSMHAGSIVQSIQRLCSMAARGGMTLEEVRELLASSFRMALHQNLEPGPDGNVLKVRSLLDTLTVAGTIRQKQVPLDNLKNDLLLQQTAQRNNNPIELRPID
jgi:twitching motility protein PilT